MTILDTIHRVHQLATDLFAAQVEHQYLQRQDQAVNQALFNLTIRQATTLRIIATAPGLSQTGIVEKTGIDRSTLAEICHRLQRKGLISRKRSRTDARAYILTLTPLGTKVLPLAQEGIAAVERALRKHISGLGDLRITSEPPKRAVVSNSRPQPRRPRRETRAVAGE